MANYFEHFIIAILLSLIILTNKTVIWEYLKSREDEAMNGLEITIGNSTTHFARVGVG